MGVEQILVSVISLFADPNDDSPANVDAAVIATARMLPALLLANKQHVGLRTHAQKQWREDKKAFRKTVRKTVAKSQEDM